MEFAKIGSKRHFRTLLNLAASFHAAVPNLSLDSAARSVQIILPIISVICFDRGWFAENAVSIGDEEDECEPLAAPS